MRFSILLSMLPLALSVAAINVTEPAKGDKLDVSHTFAVKWTSVNTDDSTVDIVLINNNVYPNVEEKIASGVDTSAGSYTVKGLKDVTVGSGFQINLLSTERQNTGILAQSQKFEVTEPDNGPSTTTTATGTASTGTSTGTNTKTGLTTSATGTSTGTATGSATASPTASEGAAMALVAPGAAAGLLAGFLAFL